MENSVSTYRKLTWGGLAGGIATLPMTIFMRLAWKWLPEREKAPLPPRQITQHVLKPSRRLSEGGKKALTLFLHFAFGTAAGMLYGWVEETIKVHPAIKGPFAGLAVWAGSYLGWIPALGILPSAGDQPWRRNLLMIAAHGIWGLVLGVCASLFKSGMVSKKSYIDLV